MHLFNKKVKIIGLAFIFSLLIVVLPLDAHSSHKFQSGSIKKNWQLREFDKYSQYNPNIVFSKSYRGDLKIDSLTNGYSSLGTGYAFVELPKSLLNGKKVSITWRGYFTYRGTRTIGSFHLFDGTFSNHDTTNYMKPNTNREGIFDVANINLADYPCAGHGWCAWRTNTSSTLNLSGYNNKVTLLVRLSDAWIQQGVMLEIRKINILNPDGTIFKTIDLRKGKVIMEQKGTYNDYGYLVQKKQRSPIRLISPNGGEKWRTGEVHQIRWSGNVEKIVLIHAKSNGRPDYSRPPITIVDKHGIPDTSGVYYWRIPNNIAAGKYYIRIYGCCNETGGFYTSKKYFTIIDNKPIKKNWQLREFDKYSQYNPNIVFSKSYRGDLKIDSLTNGYSSLGTGYAFVELPKSLLNGKKVSITWRGYFTYRGTRTIGSFHLFDGTFSNHDTTNYMKPNTNREGIFDVANINLADYPCAGHGWCAWRTNTSSTLNLSGYNNKVTLLVRLSDAWIQQGVMLEIRKINILNPDGTIFKTIDLRKGKVIMEQKGTYNDYGYLVQKKIPISKTYKNTQYGIEFDYPENYKISQEQGDKNCNNLTNNQYNCLLLSLTLDPTNSNYSPKANFDLLKGIKSVSITGQTQIVIFDSQRNSWILTQADSPSSEILPIWHKTQSGKEIIKVLVGGSNASHYYYIIPDYKNNKVAIFSFPASYRLRCDLITDTTQKANCNSFYQSVINQYNNGQPIPDTWLPENYLSTIYSESENIVKSYR